MRVVTETQKDLTDVDSRKYVPFAVIIISLQNLTRMRGKTQPDGSPAVE